MNYSKLSPEDIAFQLYTDIHKGLSSEEALRRKKLTENRMELIPLISRTIRFLIKDMLIIYSLAISVITMMFLYKGFNLMGYLTALTLIISFIVTLKDYIRHRFRKAAINLLLPKKAMVIRDGKAEVIKSKDLVLGDIVILQEKNFVPEDIRLTAVEKLTVNEEIITGIKGLQLKSSRRIIEEVESNRDQVNIAFKGSYIVRGRAAGIVVSKGKETAFEKVLGTYEKAEITSPFKKDSFNLFFIIPTIIFSILLIFLNFASLGDTEEIFLLILPYGVLFTTFPYLIIEEIVTLLMKKEYKRHGIIIDDISSIEKIQEVNVLFIEKEEVISSKKPNIIKLFYDDEERNAVEAIGDEYTFRRLMESALILGKESSKGSKEDAAFEREAFLSYSAIKGIFLESMEESYKACFTLPYDFNSKIEGIVVSIEDRHRFYSRGSVETTLINSTHYMHEGVEKELSPELKEKIRAWDYENSLLGYSTYAFAYRNFRYKPDKWEKLASNLVMAGIVALENPIRPHITDYVEALEKDGVFIYLFSEENLLVANKTGRDLNILREKFQAVSGVELTFLDQEELLKTARNRRVYSRASVEQKAKIVRHLEEDNSKTAVMGSSLKDIPALFSCYFPIAAGEKATEAIVKRSEVYLKDDFLKKFIYLRSQGRGDIITLKELKEIYIIAVIVEMILVYFLKTNNIYLINLVTMPLVAISLTLKDRSAQKRDNISISKISIIINSTTLTLLSGVSYIFTSLVLGSLYKESSTFILMSLLLLSSLNYSRISPIIIKVVYLSCFILGIAVTTSYFLDFQGLAVIIFNLFILVFFVSLELFKEKRRK